MQATEWQVFRKVMLPSASSWILTSVKISLPFALVGVILGEFLVSSQGLGYRLNAYSTSYNITGALAIVFLMMVHHAGADRDHQRGRGARAALATEVGRRARGADLTRAEASDA